MKRWQIRSKAFHVLLQFGEINIGTVYVPIKKKNEVNSESVLDEVP